MIQLYNMSGRMFAPAKPGDVGHDLHALVTDSKQSWLDRLFTEIIGWPIIVIWPFQTKTISTGIKVSQPKSVWCQIVARSSSARKHLMVFSGIIDSGYQGELFTVIRNLSLVPRVIREDERYAQAIFHPAVRPDFEDVTFVGFDAVSERADTGFGSSGR